MSHAFCLCITQLLLHRVWEAWTLDGTRLPHEAECCCQPQSLLCSESCGISLSTFWSNWGAPWDHLCRTGGWPAPPWASVHAEGGGQRVLVLRNVLGGMSPQNNDVCVLWYLLSQSFSSIDLFVSVLTQIARRSFRLAYPSQVHFPSHYFCIPVLSLLLSSPSFRGFLAVNQTNRSSCLAVSVLPVNCLHYRWFWISFSSLPCVIKCFLINFSVTLMLHWYIKT